MISTLLHYYEQNSHELPPFGFEYREISFVILLSKEGRFLDIQDRRKEGIGEKMLVPQAVKRSGVGAHPNFLWDNVRYVFGIGTFSNQKQKEALERKRSSFISNLKEISHTFKQHKEIDLVIDFLESSSLELLQSHILWKEMVESTGYISFSIENTNRLVSQEPSIVKFCGAFSEDLAEQQTMCLLSGENRSVARLHPTIQGVFGAQGSGANLVSFNLECVESFGKKQGYNAPVSQFAAFKYGTALNALLDSSRKVAFGESMTVLFWSENKSSFETVFSDFLHMRSKEALSSFLLKCGDAEEDSSSFFVHALSPHGARLSHRFSWKGTLKELKVRIKTHCKHLELQSFTSPSEALSVYSLLQSISPCRDVKHLQPRLAGEILTSILHDTPYPQNLLSLLLKRLSDEEGVSYRRVSFIKGCLSRSLPQSSFKASPLNVSEQNVGYLLGRLFAVVEMVQKQSRKKRGTSSFRNFYKMGSIAPQKIFPYLLKRLSFHVEYLTLDKGIYFKTLRDSILKFVPFYPKGLSLVDQAKFSLGYYEQKQEIFFETKKR